MKRLPIVFFLVSLALAQSTTPGGNRVEWNPSSPDALKELPDGRAQKNVASSFAVVSAIAEVTSAKHFIDPPADGGRDVTYVVIGVQNTSQQPLQIDPGLISLRVTGRKEKDLKRLKEEEVIERALHATDRYIPTVAATGMGARGGGESSQEAAITHQDLGSSDRRLQQGPEQTLAQVSKLRNKTLLPRELAPGESVMGLLFFYPYDKKDNLELSVRLGETNFVIPFSGSKNKR